VEPNSLTELAADRREKLGERDLEVFHLGVGRANYVGSRRTDRYGFARAGLDVLLLGGGYPRS
jgi:hypothetical protein